MNGGFGIIHNIYILDTNGIPIFTRIYGEIKVDPTLISGYISAQSSFFKEITGQDLEMFATKDYNFWLRRVGRFLIVIVTSKDVDPKIMKWKLSQIQLAFIMNLEKDSLKTMIDSVTFNSLNFILDNTRSDDLTTIIKHLILGITIIIVGQNRESVAKYIYTLLTVSPVYKETYFYEDRNVFSDGAIIGSIKTDINSILSDKSFLYYEFETSIIKLNNLTFDLNKKALSDFISDLISKCRSMSEITGIDFIRNNLRRILRGKTAIKEIIIKKGKLRFEDIINSLKISEDDFPAILELLQDDLKNIIIEDDSIYYQG
ncbi:MAG: hypothetical protein QW327_00980 [Candidatus Odinarchaeota archaeon]